MEDITTPREQILKKLRNALVNKSPREVSANIDFESDVFAFPDEDPEVVFAQNFTENGGHFIYCEDNAVLIDNLELLLKEIPGPNRRLLCSEPVIQELLTLAGIHYETAWSDGQGLMVCGCENIIARTGSVLLSSCHGQNLQTTLLSSKKIVIAFASQLVRDFREALTNTRARYNGLLPSMMTLFTLPVHNSEEQNQQYYVFFIDDIAQLQ